MRRAFYGLSLVVVVWSAFAVPMPVIELAPGAAPPIAPLVEITGAEGTTAINGELRLLTVNVNSPSLAEVLRAQIDERRSLTGVESVIPHGVEPDVFFEQQRRQFALSFDVAAAVGARLAGYDVDVRTAPVIAEIQPGGPSDGLLEPGDIVLQVDGVDISSAEELQAATRGYGMGDRIPLTVQRGDEQLSVEVTAGEVRGLDRPGLGVSLLGDTLLDVTFPFEVDLGPTRIGGPSAGMMIALTVYDLLAEEDLARGRVIAGTGTIRLDGTIGSISGIAEKVAAAEREDADIMLVPAELADQARAVVTTDLEVVGVATLDEALAALRR